MARDAKTIQNIIKNVVQEISPSRDYRALIFVVRTTPSFAPFINTTVVKLASQIIGFTNYNNPGYFRYYQLIGYANGAISYNMGSDDSVEFLNAINSLPISDITVSNCSDSLYRALLAAITSKSVLIYPKSPIYTFGDNLPNDPTYLSKIYQHVEGEYQGGPIFNIITGLTKNACNFDNDDPENRQLRNFAHFTHGFISFLPQDTVVDTAFNFYYGTEESKLLATADFIDHCLIGKELTRFIFDNSTNQVTVFATGNSLNLQVFDSTGKQVTQNFNQKSGNTQMLQFMQFVEGSYSVQAISADNSSPCQIRVYGDDAYKSVSTGNAVTYFY
uniref:Gingipain domain-containing protein n=1 Tax=Panagrolaimus sp. ES5 TaxID=591445 RepID=A0AC34FNP8_9BILA